MITLRIPLLMISLAFSLSLSLSARETVEREVYLMGTNFHAAVFEGDRDRGLQQIERMVGVVDETEDQLSTWRTNSELSKINQLRRGKRMQMTPSLCSLMQRLRSWSEVTDGAFDPTLGQLLKAWGIQSKPRIPDREEIRGALSETGFRHIHQTDCAIIKDAEVLFDAGAFGKGEALDRAADLAKKEGYAPAVLDFGGQVLVQGLQEPLTVSIADPSDREAGSAVKVPLAFGSLSTSSGSERDVFVNGKRVGHIVDPRTGHPVPFFGSVTVWSPKAFDADVLSTALYVMGPVKGFEWAEKHAIAACFLLRDTKKVIATAEFRKLLNAREEKHEDIK